MSASAGGKSSAAPQASTALRRNSAAIDSTHAKALIVQAEISTSLIDILNTNRIVWRTVFKSCIVAQ